MTMGFESILKCFLLLMGPIFFSSCTKDKQPQSNPVSRTALLTSAPWKVTAVTYNRDWGNGVIEVGEDQFALFETCSKDDLTIYYLDGSGSYDQGPDKCLGASQTRTFSWSFYHPFTGLDENVIKLTNSGYVALTIVELTSEILKVKNFTSGGFLLYTYSH